MAKTVFDKGVAFTSSVNETGEIIVVGHTPFTIPAEKFYITPISSACKLYLIEEIGGAQIEKEISDIDANKFTSVNGVGGSTWKLNVSDSVTFKVKW